MRASTAAELAWFNEHRMCFKLEVALRDGRGFTVATEFPRDRPVQGQQEIVAKFRQLATVVLSASQADEIIDAVMKLEHVDKVASVAAMLVPRQPQAAAPDAAGPAYAMQRRGASC